MLDNVEKKLNPFLTPKKNPVLPEGLKNGDVLCLVSQGETIIGRVAQIDGNYVELYKPHIVLAQPTQTGGLQVGFMPYGELSLLTPRTQRWFNAENFIQVDIANAQAAKHFSTSISGLVAPNAAGGIL